MNNVIKEKLSKLPKQSGVYIMKNSGGSIIYIGKAKVLKNRVTSYFTGTIKDAKTLGLVSNIADFEFIVTLSELDALILENNLIKKHKPHYNILLKDGKAYPYIKITTKDDFPKLEIVRKVKKDGNKYFGPYFAGIRPKELLEIVNYAYPVRTCNLNLNNGRTVGRECLNYFLGLCSAPCTGRISKEDYRKHINDAIEFLKGDTAKVKEILVSKMQNASNMQKFETAIKLRDQLNTLDRLKHKFTTQFTNLINMDIIGYHDNGLQKAVAVLIVRDGKMLGADTINLGQEKAENEAEVISSFITQYYSGNIAVPDEVIVGSSLEDEQVIEQFLNDKRGKKVNVINPKRGTKLALINQANENAKQYLLRSTNNLKIKQQRTMGALGILKNKLKLQKTPYRIECYDISNISGTDKVASMVVFINGEKASKHYRKFRIKTVVGQDDFASMEEVLKRRFSKTEDKDDSFSSIPDLVLIDGGKGQLSSAVKAVSTVGQFNTEFISIAKREEEVFKEGQSIPYILQKTSYGLQLLQRLRDEAHRFAITYHRSLREKRVTSQLDKIEGIGPKKRVALLKHFKSIKNIKTASVDELTEVSGINEQIAIKIQQYFIEKE